MSYPSKDDFEQTLKIADFAAQRLENRRQTVSAMHLALHSANTSDRVFITNLRTMPLAYQNICLETGHNAPVCTLCMPPSNKGVLHGV